VSGDGVITIKLVGYSGDWPEMKMAKDGVRIRLYARSGDDGFVFGGRAGGVETDEMKPFWPFALVESERAPGVTPVRISSELKTFACPKLPEDFEWQGELIRFTLPVDISAEGEAKVQKYWTQDVRPSNQYLQKDWRLKAVGAATAALELWEFYPEKEDGKPTSTNGFWHFDISRVDGMVRWVVVDNASKVFDSMPRRSQD